MNIDVDRAQVYAAEEAAFGGTVHDAPTRFEHLERLALLVMALPWWHGPVVPVVTARADARSSSARLAPGGVEIRLAPPQWTPVTLTHELAHVLAGIDGGHGPEFRRAHVDIVAAALGEEEAGWLLDAYLGFGLAVPDSSREVQRAEPSVRVDGAIAL